MLFYKKPIFLNSYRIYSIIYPTSTSREGLGHDSRLRERIEVPPCLIPSLLKDWSIGLGRRFLIDFGKSFFYIKLNKFKFTLWNIDLKNCQRLSLQLFYRVKKKG
jgi:hypothetical protein